MNEQTMQTTLNALIADAMLTLDRPVCRMRFASETEGQFDQLLDRLPSVTCTFVEAV